MIYRNFIIFVFNFFKSCETERCEHHVGILCPEISRYVFGSVLCVFMIPRCAPGPKNITFGNDSVICDN